MGAGGTFQALTAEAAIAVLEALPVDAAVLDAEGIVVASNASWRRHGGTAVGTSFAAEPGIADDELRSLVDSSVQRVATGRSDHVELEVPVDDVGDGLRWKLLLLQRVDEVGAVVVRVDVTRSHEVLDIVSDSALRDGLTGLPNRSLLEDRIATAVARTERGRSAPAVLFLDLDGFKAVNDKYGHEAGDRVLATVGQRLNASLRAADSCGRWGGDEFVAIVDVERGEGAGALGTVIDRIHEKLNAPLVVDDAELDVGVSIGAVLVRPGDTPAELVALADAAMYEAKRSNLRAVVAERDVIDLRLA